MDGGGEITLERAICTDAASVSRLRGVASGAGSRAEAAGKTGDVGPESLLLLRSEIVIRGIVSGLAGDGSVLDSCCLGWNVVRLLRDEGVVDTGNALACARELPEGVGNGTDSTEPDDG